LHNDFNSYLRGELRTVATHLQSGTEIETDAPVDIQGKGRAIFGLPISSRARPGRLGWPLPWAFKPRDLQVDLRGMKLSILKIMKPDPRRIAAFKRGVRISGLPAGG